MGARVEQVPGWYPAEPVAEAPARIPIQRALRAGASRYHPAPALEPALDRDPAPVALPAE